MKSRSRTTVLLTLFALGVTLAWAGAATAQGPDVSGSIQITFGSNPHWTSVRGTHVSMIVEKDRPDYDMFRCGRAYYVYRDDHWYRGRRPRGEFRPVEVRELPPDLHFVTRDHWRHFPPGWEERQNGPGKHGRGRALGHDKH